MSWKKLKTTKLLDHPRLQIYEDDVELPGGHKTKYLYFKGHPEAAMIIAINDKGKILLQREYSYPPDEWLYQLPGGAQNKGESIIETARRELAEESDLSGDLHQIGWYYVDNRRKASKIFVFVATNCKPLKDHKDTKDDEEEFEHFWLTKKEINELIRKGEIVNYSLLSGWAQFMNSKYY